MTDDWIARWDAKVRAHADWPEFWKAWAADRGSDKTQEGKCLIAFGERMADIETERQREALYKKLNPPRRPKVGKDGLTNRERRLLDHIGDALDEHLEPRLADIINRLNILEDNQTSYRGVWRAAEDEWYHPKQIVTHAGQLWHCERMTKSKPGTPNSGWRLMQKAYKPTRSKT